MQKLLIEIVKLSRRFTGLRDPSPSSPVASGKANRIAPGTLRQAAIVRPCLTTGLKPCLAFPGMHARIIDEQQSMTPSTAGNLSSNWPLAASLPFLMGLPSLGPGQSRAVRGTRSDRSFFTRERHDSPAILARGKRRADFKLNGENYGSLEPLQGSG